MNDLLYLPSKRTVRIRPDLHDNPMRAELPRDRRAARIILALVSIWGAVGTVGLFHGLANLTTTIGLGFMSALVLAWAITAVAILFGVLAMRVYVSNDAIILNDKDVQLTTYSMFGKRRWRAPYSEFRGLRLSQTKAGSGAKAITYQLIELAHPDEDKTLPIYLAKSSHPPRQFLQELADRLGVAVL